MLFSTQCVNVHVQITKNFSFHCCSKISALLNVQFLPYINNMQAQLLLNHCTEFNFTRNYLIKQQCMLIARNFHFYIIYANFNLAFLILNLNCMKFNWCYLGRILPVSSDNFIIIGGGGGITALFKFRILPIYLIL